MITVTEATASAGALKRLSDEGVSIWLDDLSRRRIESGNVNVHDSLATAVDSLVAGDAAVFTQLREAAQHMPMTAGAIAAAVVAATS